MRSFLRVISLSVKQSTLSPLHSCSIQARSAHGRDVGGSFRFQFGRPRGGARRRLGGCWRGQPQHAAGCLLDIISSWGRRPIRCLRLPQLLRRQLQQQQEGMLVGMLLSRVHCTHSARRKGKETKTSWARKARRRQRSSSVTSSNITTTFAAATCCHPMQLPLHRSIASRSQFLL